MVFSNVDGTKFSKKSKKLLIILCEEITKLFDDFKMIHGFENKYFPINEYLFQSLQSKLEDTLFLGASYEKNFDRFEVLYSLLYADYSTEKSINWDGKIWGPSGRFFWKFSNVRSEDNPFKEIIDEAKILEDNWEPLKSNLFRGSFTKFDKLSEEFTKWLESKGTYF